jgi:hypothetical protein
VQDNIKRINARDRSSFSKGQHSHELKCVGDFAPASTPSAQTRNHPVVVQKKPDRQRKINRAGTH